MNTESCNHIVGASNADYEGASLIRINDSIYYDQPFSFCPCCGENLSAIHPLVAKHHKAWDRYREWISKGEPNPKMTPPKDIIIAHPADLWKSAPDWAIWAAMDEDGQWHFYAKNPRRGLK